MSSRITALPLQLLCLLFAVLIFTNGARADYAAVTRSGEGAIATVNPMATNAAIEAFEAGGNAIDAAVAAALTLGVVDGYNSGIGGGCFILVRWADGRLEAIDGREMAPMAAHRDMYVKEGQLQPSLSKTGALASGVPGSLAAYDYLLAEGGKRTLAQALQPGRVLAENGFELDQQFARRLGWAAPAMKQFPASAKIFLKPDGSALGLGDRLVQKDLAATYEAIANQGISYFYKGAFPEKLAAWMRANGGILTAEDFAAYRLVTREPLVSQYRDYQIIGFPPPSSGGVHVAQMLNMLERFPVDKLTDSQRHHLLAEVMKLAFADRSYWLGDPDFVKVPRGLINNEYTDQLAAKVSMEKATPVIKAGSPADADVDFFGKHTTHVAAADKAGNWVAITTTVNTTFGSKVVIPGTGVVMNNQMDDFSIHPGQPNAFGLVGSEANGVAAGKRPLSSMSPTIVLKNNQPIMTLGAAGGPTIITQVLQALVNSLDLNMSMDEALGAVRVHHQWQPDVLLTEESMHQAERDALSDKGHKIKIRDYLGATQAIRLSEDNQFEAASEPRLVQRYNQ